MPLGKFESEVLRVISQNRSPESHVAGATVLNRGEDTPRISNDIDLNAPYGCFFLNRDGEPQTPTAETLASLKPHFGTLRGCWPRIVEEE